MVRAYASRLYAVGISTLRGDADCEMSCLFASTTGPLADYRCFVTRDFDERVAVHSLFAFPAGAELLIGVWARCVALMPLRRMHWRHWASTRGAANFVSVSVYECPVPDELNRSRLLEHLVVYRQGTKLLVGFSDETDCTERVSPARPACNNPWEMALHAAGILLWGVNWAGAAPPAPRAFVGDTSARGSGHAPG
jgi:hypothetical protein